MKILLEYQFTFIKELILLKEKKQELSNVLQREPSLEELADICDMDVEKVIEILKRDKNVVSLDTPIKRRWRQ